MSDKRQTLKILSGISVFTALGSTLPLKLGKPVINSILLPVHAQTPALVASCFIEGPKDIEFSNALPAINFFVRNTGTTELTNMEVIADYEHIFGISMVALNSPPNPLATGASHMLTISGGIAELGYPGVGTLTIELTFSETSCTFVTSLNCRGKKGAHQAEGPKYGQPA